MIEAAHSLESLLTELSTLDWTVSWAYQFSPNHWRVSICQILSWNGYDQPDYLISHCADAPTFAEALEDAMSRRAEAELIRGQKTAAITEGPRQSLLEALAQSLPQPAPIRRRV